MSLFGSDDWEDAEGDLSEDFEDSIGENGVEKPHIHKAQMLQSWRLGASLVSALFCLALIVTWGLYYCAVAAYCWQTRDADEFDAVMAVFLWPSLALLLPVLVSISALIVWAISFPLSAGLVGSNAKQILAVDLVVNFLTSGGLGVIMGYLIVVMGAYTILWLGAFFPSYKNENTRVSVALGFSLSVCLCVQLLALICYAGSSLMNATYHGASDNAPKTDVASPTADDRLG